MGDELQSSIKILFFYMVKLSKSLSSVHPSLCLRSTFASGSLVLRFKSASKPFLKNRREMGLTRESHRS